jgi:hypothetical protein
LSAHGRLCCKSPKSTRDDFYATRRSKPRSLMDMASSSLARLPVSSSPCDEVPHMFTRKPRLQPGKFLNSGAKRLLQHNLPCVDGPWLARRIFTSRCWSVQPCVRPVCAVHMTAGHNALRGSGPGQKPAFDNALAHVGCPDRRIDRLCITCCSPSQPSHHAGWMPSAISVTPRVRRVPCIARPWPSLPKPFWRSCWRARWRRPSSVAAPTRP